MLPIGIFYQFYAYFALVLSIPILYMQLRARNIPCLLLLFWLTLTTLIYVVESAIWSNPYAETIRWMGYGLCDITSRIVTCSSIGIPASAFTLVLYLDTVIRRDHPLKRYENWIWHVCLSILLPLIIMAMMVPLESNRYVVICMNGCYSSFYQTWYTLLFFYIPPCLLSFGGLFFVSRIVVLYWRRQRELQQFFQRDSQLTSKRFLRLLCLAAVFFLGYFPLTIFMVVANGKLQQFLPFNHELVEAWHQESITYYPTTKVGLNDWVPPTVLYLMSLFFSTSGGWTEKVALILWSLLVWLPFTKNTALGRHAQFKLDCCKSIESTMAGKTLDSTDFKEKCLVLERQWSKSSIPSDNSSELQDAAKYV
ncbi:pheromone M-factor receptor Map3 [Schizosaccharomyces pombe]|uniref:Pheromone M-factor receptor n=1 Tax=Schizosaccharomyces pombe (strain 972 / ATCC 24843) TaxID=284812 RepID=MAP3_SCHPO|nr:pheromone M-factor receptor Map3 [Schizosaccharomyces pombe]P31397.1 RecName: Full=Pheromone M-factor receptor [Schizosaccharomyces pombe 972h-]BAA01727.1 M-factor receptor [Schizosaccharomyces pombe]CAA93308.1 pheromone M-factor receptor Map3 [Schizosaccharomyces pombe]|eukprot:NP_001342813.1 pheromone M-factor receptor Map3 [Schizosaccharomyces pombe]